MRKLRSTTTLPRTRNPRRFILGVISWIVRKTFGNVLISRIRESIYRFYNRRNTGVVGLLTFRLDYEKCWWEQSCFDNIIEVPYEYIDMPIPAEYDKILSVQYGDWQKPVKGASQHTEIFFDVDRPYTVYLKKWGYIK